MQRSSCGTPHWRPGFPGISTPNPRPQRRHSSHPTDRRRQDHFCRRPGSNTPYLPFLDHGLRPPSLQTLETKRKWIRPSSGLTRFSQIGIPSATLPEGRENCFEPVDSTGKSQERNSRFENKKKSGQKALVNIASLAAAASCNEAFRHPGDQSQNSVWRSSEAIVTGVLEGKRGLPCTPRPGHRILPTEINFRRIFVR